MNYTPHLLQSNRAVLAHSLVFHTSWHRYKASVLLTLHTSLGVTLSVAQFQLHSEGSSSSNRHGWRNIIYLHDKSLHSCARVATLEQQPVREQGTFKSQETSVDHKSSRSGRFYTHSKWLSLVIDPLGPIPTSYEEDMWFSYTM